MKEIFRKMNLALKLTAFRVVLIPIFIIVYFMDFPLSNWVAWAIFAIASITDFFDGYVARKYNQSTKLGALLDPVADKILVAVTLISVLVKHSDGWAGVYLMICTITIIGREIIISALREFMSGLGIRNAVAVKYIGKVKTTVQIFAIGFLIVFDKTWFIPTYQIGYTLMGIAAILTVWSMLDYFKAASVSLKKNNIDVYK